MYGLCSISSLPLLCLYSASTIYALHRPLLCLYFLCYVSTLHLSTLYSISTVCSLSFSTLSVLCLCLLCLLCNCFYPVCLIFSVCHWSVCLSLSVFVSPPSVSLRLYSLCCMSLSVCLYCLYSLSRSPHGLRTVQNVHA